MDDDRSGQVVAGNYRVERELGRGAFGVVWLARRESDGQPLVLKVLHTQWAKVPTVLERFRREATVSSRIQHPNVAQVYDYSQTDDGVPFMALEYLPGLTLKEELKRHGAMPLVRAADLWSQVCDAVAAAHAAGIVHRDLKPENVMLTPRGGREIPVVLDFGIAKVLDAAEKLTSTGSMLGTPTYMAPEQCRGQTDLGPPADVYALGAICFELLSGKPPFTGKTVAELAMKHLLEPPPPLLNAPPRLADIVARCLGKEPQARPAAGALADALRYAATQPFTPPPPSHAAATITAAAPALDARGRPAVQVPAPRTPPAARSPVAPHRPTPAARPSASSIASTVMMGAGENPALAPPPRPRPRHTAPRRAHSGPPTAAIVIALGALMAAIAGLVAALVLRS